MKKFLLLSTLALVTNWSIAQDVIVIEDFDVNLNLNAWIGDGGSYFNTTDQAPASLSNLAGKYNLTDTLIMNGANWMGTRVNAIMGNEEAWGGYDIDNYPYYSIDVYSDSTINMGLKVEDASGGEPKLKIAEAWADYTTPGQWQTLVFDLSAGIGLGADNEMVFLMDIFNETNAKVFYVDNYKAYKNPVQAIGEIANSTVGSAYPNPATSNITIEFNIVNTSNVKLSITDLLGNQVDLIDLGMQSPGAQSTRVDVSNLVAGIYAYSLISNGHRDAKTFVVR